MIFFTTEKYIFLLIILYNYVAWSSDFSLRRKLRVNLVILGPEGSKTLNFLRRPGSAHIFFTLMVENNFVSIQNNQKSHVHPLA